MSGIVGIYARDGSPVDAAALRRMSHAVRHRGRDGTGFWTDRSFGLGHRLLSTGPGPDVERQPCIDEEHGLAVVLDGRIDNREELDSALSARAIRPRNVTDGELVLAAYRCWGADFVARVVGDFALVVVDVPARRIVCARDPLGIRPFHYVSQTRRFLFASEVCGLLAHPAVSRVPNEGMIAEYIAAAIVNQEETLYAGIRRVPPGHVLVVDANGETMRRYWDPADVAPVRYGDSEQYAEHFRGLFQEAVRCRLDGEGPVAAELSGGLDSSSVVVVADRLLTSAGHKSRLEAVCLMFPGLECDESPYMEEVLRLSGVRANGVASLVQRPAYYARCARRLGDFPGFPNGVMSNGITKMLARAKVRVLLTGLGGDHWLTGAPDPVAELVQALRGGSAPGLVTTLRTVRPVGLIRGLLRRAAAGILDWRRTLRAPGVPHYMEPVRARRLGLGARLRHQPLPAEGNHARASFSAAYGGWQIHEMEVVERRATSHGVETRHPFFDSRLVEFALGVPAMQLYRRGASKFVLRAAMRGMLPEPVRTRPTKADFSHVFVESLRRHLGASMPGSVVLAPEGWLRVDRVRGMYEQMLALYDRGDSRYCEHIYPLWMLHMMDVWMAEVFGAGWAPAKSVSRRSRDAMAVNVV